MRERQVANKRAVAMMALFTRRRNLAIVCPTIPNQFQNAKVSICRGGRHKAAPTTYANTRLI